MKVYVLHWLFLNGRRFEHEDYIKVFETREGALEHMEACYEETVKCFRISYDNEVLTTNKNDNSFEVYVTDYEDYSEAYILEQDLLP